MGFKDWFGKGKKTVAENREAVVDGVDKAADLADDKTGGKYADQIDQGAEEANDFVEGLGDEDQ